MSPADGVVESVTVLRGTALVSEGDAVVRGQVLVSGRVAAGEEGYRDTYPVAWCALLCECVAEYESAEKSEEARERAVAKAALLAEGETVTANIFVSGDEGAYVYRVSLTYRRVCSAGV